jgi:hypothetical protein
MKAHRALLLVLLILAACGLALPLSGALAGGAKEVDHAALAKKKFDFDNLAGKKGLTYSAKGLDVPAILEKHGLKVTGTLENFIPGQGVAVTFVVQPKAAAAEAPAAGAGPHAKAVASGRWTMWVAASPPVVQEMLFDQEFSEYVRSLPADIYLEGFEKSAGLGDFCIASNGKKAWTEVLFARGNIAFRLTDAGTLGDLKDVAKTLDNAVQKQPDMKEKDWAAMPMPQVSAAKFGPVAPDPLVEIPLTLKPPLGEGQSVVVQCPEGPSGNFNAAKGVVQWHHNVPGAYRLSIAVYDKATLMIRWTTVEVEVQGGAAK